MKVLLTGVSGFLGTHTAIRLLEKGYHVVGTLRNLQRAGEVKQVIGRHTRHLENLAFVQADLADQGAWEPLMKGMDFVQHIASPFPTQLPKNDAELVLPARAGTTAILQAAARNGVKRVVLTSSACATLHGKPKGQQSGTFDETVWADETNIADTTPYYRSKIIAEKAAWAFMQQDRSGLELATVLPGAILGPVLEKDFGTSANIVVKVLDGSLPAVPQIGFDIADVRSVADLLISAMENPAAAGQRFLATSGFLTMQEITDILRKQYPNRKIPKGTLPVWFTHVLSWFDKTLQPVMLDLGKARRGDSTKARKLLGWQPIENDEAVLSCAKSLIALNLVK